jgi:hypothetical protein
MGRRRRRIPYLINEENDEDQVGDRTNNTVDALNEQRLIADDTEGLVDRRTVVIDDYKTESSKQASEFQSRSAKRREMRGKGRTNR